MGWIIHTKHTSLNCIYVVNGFGARCFACKHTFLCLIAAENFAVIGNIKCIVTGYGGFRSFLISRLMILFRVGNRNFCFANNRGAFLKTMKMAIKGAKMRGIVNTKLQPRI